MKFWTKAKSFKSISLNLFKMKTMYLKWKQESFTKAYIQKASVENLLLEKKVKWDKEVNHVILQQHLVVI